MKLTDKQRESAKSKLIKRYLSGNKNWSHWYSGDYAYHYNPFNLTCYRRFSWSFAEKEIVFTFTPDEANHFDALKHGKEV